MAMANITIQMTVLFKVTDSELQCWLNEETEEKSSKNWIKEIALFYQVDLKSSWYGGFCYGSILCGRIGGQGEETEIPGVGLGLQCARATGSPPQGNATSGCLPFHTACFKHLVGVGHMGKSDRIYSLFWELWLTPILCQLWPYL